ncbi:RNA polymerase sigma-70 factor, ECF subfamily [Lutibacter oricola]|uniref:RNA polymerase sigma-70 factor, ECF subfamily n=1 Tax=Lutibacter oricola TaxID=762486 RepID=A0A1H3AQY0_9FLAO|nr:sigma-70 family RNA polymerase sigma factor [Lutibacter oricola]SDX32053.1 RNA polymerase sigma-70 factor, ECF subfamily [Lutibacter oricola]
MVNKNVDIDELIKKARSKDQKAFNALLNTYWSDVFRFQFSKTDDEDEAEDITIKTFSKAFDKIHLYNDKYNFKTWLISISKNIFLDHIRKQRTEVISINKKESEAYKIFDESPSAEDQLIIEQNLVQLLNYIKQLKPHYQEIINLRYFNEMSYKEMASHLNEPMSNIKVKLLRAKKLLAEIITKS